MKLILADELRRISRGEVLSDNWSKKIYSVDASHFNIVPVLIQKPTDEEDLRHICEFCHTNNIAITARGAGTGLLGQALSSGIVIDLTASMNKIIEIGEDYVDVQPGLVKGILDYELEKKKKFFPPDPASSNFCTIGGMVNNNSSGPHSLGYGSTIDLVQDISIIYPDGTSSIIGPSLERDKKISNMLDIISSNYSLIQRKYPKVSKNSCGYRLDAALSNKGFFPQKVFVSSEGTLGITTSTKLRIFDIPLYQNLLIVGYQNLSLAMQSVPSILKFCPTALEMLDSPSISSERKGDSGCLLFTEFSGDDLTEVEQKFSRCKGEVERNGEILQSAFDLVSIKRIWESRKNALNSIMKFTVGSRKPVALIEDTVVNPGLLHDYSTFLNRLYSENKLDYVMYGHVGNGNLHTRPIVDTEQRSEIDILENLAKEVFEKVISYGGTITGEHGDGLARSRYVQMLYGFQLYSVFKQIKKIFDPHLIMNPGKKVIFPAYENVTQAQ